jgi:hypothetical protein
MDELSDVLRCQFRFQHFLNIHHRVTESINLKEYNIEVTEPIYEYQSFTILSPIIKEDIVITMYPCYISDSEYYIGYYQWYDFYDSYETISPEKIWKQSFSYTLCSYEQVEKFIINKIKSEMGG